VKQFEDTFSRLDTITAVTDGRTDGQTERQTDSHTRCRSKECAMLRVAQVKRKPYPIY